MKKILSVLLICMIILSVPIVVFAKENNENMIIKKDEVVNSDLFAAEDSVKNMGTVHGDIFAAGGEFENTGHVLGDIILGVGNSKIDGKVDGNLRIGTGNLTITGEIGKNVTSFSGSFILEEKGAVDGNINALSGNIVIDGIVGGDFRGSTGDIKINGEIKGDVTVEADALSFGPNAKIGGNLVYTSEKEVDIPNGVVSGTTEHKLPKIEPAEKKVEKGIKLLNMVHKGVSIISYLIIGVILTLVFKNFIKKTAAKIDEKPLYSLGIGVVGLIVTPIISILIMITVVGIPLGVIGLILYGLLLYLSKIPAALWIGEKILKNEENPLLPMILGISILLVGSFIPYLGRFVSFVAIVFGLGSYLLSLKEAIQKPKNIDPLNPEG